MIEELLLEIQGGITDRINEYLKNPPENETEKWIFEGALFELKLLEKLLKDCIKGIEK